ncbi:MAG: single-stranded DNA-binding protein [Candidatus Woesearchaeota archaeon]|jgi:single-strand DNA-binding protein
MTPYKGTLNEVRLIGNLTADPEVRQTPNGQMVANLRIATNRGYKDATGQLKEIAEFHNVVVWAKLAEIASKYLSKGRKVYVAGRLQTRSWEGQDGVKRYTTEIVADHLMMLTPPPKNDASKETQAPVEEHQSADLPDTQVKGIAEDMIIEDLPF